MIWWVSEWVPFYEKHPEVQGIVIPASDVSHFSNPKFIWVVIINMACMMTVRWAVK